MISLVRGTDCLQGSQRSVPTSVVCHPGSKLCAVCAPHPLSFLLTSLSSVRSVVARHCNTATKGPVLATPTQKPDSLMTTYVVQVCVLNKLCNDLDQDGWKPVSQIYSSQMLVGAGMASALLNKWVVLQ